ncbi:uncharacterized protein LOC144639204 isoform X2 [Oculina patagonica]
MVKPLPMFNGMIFHFASKQVSTGTASSFKVWGGFRKDYKRRQKSSSHWHFSVNAAAICASYENSKTEEEAWYQLKGFPASLGIQVCVKDVSSSLAGNFLYDFLLNV